MLYSKLFNYLFNCLQVFIYISKYLIFVSDEAAPCES